MLVVPFAGSTVASDVSVMVEPVGASSGTFSHATAIIADTATMAAKADGRRRRDIMKTITILIPMDLAGQAGRKCTGQRGYAMAALLVAMSVHGDHVHGGDAGLEADRATREGRGTGLPRQAVRPRHRPLPAQVRERVSAQHRRARRAALPPQEIQGSDHERRLRPDSSRAGRARRHASTGRAARRDGLDRFDRARPGARGVCRATDGRTCWWTADQRGRSDAGRHSGRRQQEQGSIDSPL